jgi:hypothetical protein
LGRHRRRNAEGHGVMAFHTVTAEGKDKQSEKNTFENMKEGWKDLRVYMGMYFSQSTNGIKKWCLGPIIINRTKDKAKGGFSLGECMRVTKVLQLEKAKKGSESRELRCSWQTCSQKKTSWGSDRST